MMFATIPVYLWALRLSYHIWKRHTSEDYRYLEMRQRWEAKGDFYYYFASYFYVFLMQGLFSLINNSACLFINLYSKENVL
jgi:steroid 5-alpha reductase family enzyme